MPSDSIAFDRAADYYDSTRGFPPGEDRAVAAMIARAGLFHIERGEVSPLDLNAFATQPIPGLVAA